MPACGSDPWAWLLLQVSLMVHPDKCSHPQAKEAFEMLNSANTALLSEERRREVVHVLNMAKGAALMFSMAMLPSYRPRHADVSAVKSLHCWPVLHSSQPNCNASCVNIKEPGPGKQVTV